MWRNFSHVFGRALRETGQSLERVAYRANDIEVYKTFVNRVPVYTLFGKRPKINQTGFIAPNAAIVGDVRVGHGSSVWYGAVLRGDSNSIRVGSESSIGDNTIVHVSSKYGLRGVPNPTTIGNGVVVEPGCVIHACTLEDGSVIGAGSVVADGSVVGESAQVEAGSFVGQGTQIPPRQVWGGKPARYIRSLSEEEVQNSSNAVTAQAGLASKHNTLQKQSLDQRGDYDDAKTFYHLSPEAQERAIHGQ